MNQKYQKPKYRRDYIVTTYMDTVKGKQYGYQMIAEWLPKGSILPVSQYILDPNDHNYTIKDNNLFAVVKKEGFYAKFPVMNNEEDEDLPFGLKHYSIQYIGNDLPWTSLPSVPVGFAGNQNNYQSLPDDEFYAEIRMSSPTPREKEENEKKIHDLIHTKNQLKTMIAATKHLLLNSKELQLHSNNNISNACCHAFNINLAIKKLCEKKVELIQNRDITDLVHAMTILKKEFPNMDKEIDLIMQSYYWVYIPDVIVNETATVATLIELDRLYHRIQRLIEMNWYDVPDEIIQRQCALVSTSIVRLDLSKA